MLKNSHRKTTHLKAIFARFAFAIAGRRTVSGRRLPQSAPDGGRIRFKIFP
jgi:hypothetical protein